MNDKYRNKIRDEHPDWMILDHTLAITVPSRCRCGAPLLEHQVDRAKKNIRQFMIDNFGGDRCQAAVGDYRMDTGELAQEDNFWVMCKATAEDFESHWEEIEAFVQNLADELFQECLAVEINSDMILVPSRNSDKRCGHIIIYKKTGEPFRVGSQDDLKDAPLIKNLIFRRNEKGELVSDWPARKEDDWDNPPYEEFDYDDYMDMPFDEVPEEYPADDDEFQDQQLPDDWR